MKDIDPQKSIGFLVYEVSRLMRRDFDERVRPLGLTQIQWRAIVHLARREGCNQATLAEQLEVRPITLTRLIDRLIESGWVERRADPGDRRAVQLYLTEKARPLLRLMQEKSGETRAKALKGLDEQEINVLIEALVAIKANLSTEDSS